MKTRFLFCTERASFSLVIFEKTIIIGLELRKKLGEWREQYRDRWLEYMVHIAFPLCDT